MTEQTVTTVEKLVMLVTGALVIVAMPVLGLIVTVTGSMSPMVVYSQGDSSGYALAPGAIPEGAEILTTPIIGPNARAMLLAAALVLFGLLAVYKLFQPEPGAAPTTAPETTEQ